MHHPDDYGIGLEKAQALSFDLTSEVYDEGLLNYGTNEYDPVGDSPSSFNSTVQKRIQTNNIFNVNTNFLKAVINNAISGAIKEPSRGPPMYIPPGYEASDYK